MLLLRRHPNPNGRKHRLPSKAGRKLCIVTIDDHSDSFLDTQILSNPQVFLDVDIGGIDLYPKKTGLQNKMATTQKINGFNFNGSPMEFYANTIDMRMYSLNIFFNAAHGSTASFKNIISWICYGASKPLPAMFANSLLWNKFL